MRRAIATAAATLALCTAFAPSAQAAFGFLPGSAGFDAAATEAGGGAATLAGSHPFALTIEVGLSPEAPAGPGQPGGDLKDLFVGLPPGLIANPAATIKCSQADFSTPRSSPYEASRSGESCPPAAQIGTVALRSAAGVRTFGLFNLPAPPGSPARLGASPFGAPFTFVPRVGQEGGAYALTLAARNLTQLVDLQGVEITLWGNPAAAAHDGRRGNCLSEVNPSAPHGSCPVTISEQTHPAWAYLTLPSSCEEPLSFTAAAASWASPGRYLPGGEPDLSDPAWKSAAASRPALADCGSLSFPTQAQVLAGSEIAGSPTGLSLRLETFQGQNGAALTAANGRLGPQVKRVVVSLPAGMTLNPSVAAGLGACTPAQFAAETAFSAPGAGCPNSSKVGSATVETPLLEAPLAGSLFIATPFDNPYGVPYALYFVAKSSERGFVVKVAGRLDADPASGHLTATFDQLPQLPYANLRIEFREGQRAPLVTPAQCGTYTSRIALVPWSDSVAPPAPQSSRFTLRRGLGAGGACPAGAAPFAPGAIAGDLNPSAGSFTTFYLHLTRTDADQEITSYSAQLPAGLLGKIAGVPFCSDAAIAAAKHRSGFAELASPSCPAASQIGHTFTGFGVGLAPAYAPGGLYLAGPFHGQPLSVVAIDPAAIGPFDLGTIVIRSAIHIDPRSAQVTIDSSASDPIPHIFAGIPLRLRDIRVYIDRPGFMVNPTDCARKQLASALTGSDAPFTNPRSASATAAVPFQAFNCSSLKFEPRVALAVKGKPKRGGYQQLSVTVTPRGGDANIKSAALTLPPTLFLAQNHLRTICTRPQSTADACPAAAAVGSAEASTPLLGKPLAGPVYLRSSDHPLPDLAIALRGENGIRIDLECRVDSNRGGLRGRCEGLPDAPVSRFTLTIFGGAKRGILIASDNLCRSPQLAESRFFGHNDLGLVAKPKLGVRCKKGRQRGR